ncbi:MAG: hypothetical protein AVDCRST_MAG18-1306 [uncultured Thermomicrobiales bacterium]|uniref:Uncharacterized protein n=1 Tax=uncultured Thermomicrobiales bacterium TaxID=1645740 RepID=A0A6J4V3M8_9BACT|nr:MAG: hypothetical protein AVDCRST_MAG18-1306 [uncultured Thermomicrobiales bacterium]
MQNDPAVLQVVGVPRTSVQTAQPIPRAGVMDRIVKGLGGTVAGTALTPAASG